MASGQKYQLTESTDGPFDTIEDAEDHLMVMEAMPGYQLGYVLTDTLEVRTVFMLLAGPLVGTQRPVWKFGANFDRVEKDKVDAERPTKLTVYTVQIAKWKVPKQMGIKMVDTTVKSGMKFLAPTWEMVMGHKRGELSDEAYTRMFLEMMDESLDTKKENWEWLVELGTVALGCYCAKDAFCHRQLLVSILEKYCRDRGIEFEYKGELE